MAIVVGGGPAPGINSVIGAATIRACLSGVEVIGIVDGYQWLAQGDTSHVIPLGIEKVGRLHFRGGSLLGISRFDPTRRAGALEGVVRSLRALGVDRLVSIGGDGTAFTALRIWQEAGREIRVVHVPKTIDNDIDLPEGAPTFGFQTARHAGVALVKDLQVDAHTTSRWYFIVTMGRKAGHLALGIGKAAGATLTVIPEELPGRPVPLRRIEDILVGAIVKRLAYGRRDGTAVIAEGVAERLDPEELARIAELPFDPTGSLHIAELNLAELLKKRVEARLAEMGLAVTLAAKSIGYELRCTDPIPFDMEYTRDLGYCAAKHLLEGGNGDLVCIAHGRFRPVPLADLVDAHTGRMRVRMVDVDTEHYKIARRYMLSLRRDDFSNSEELARVAEAAKMAVGEFRRRFEYLVLDEPPPIRFGSGRTSAHAALG